MSSCPYFIFASTYLQKYHSVGFRNYQVSHLKKTKNLLLSLCPVPSLLPYLCPVCPLLFFLPFSPIARLKLPRVSLSPSPFFYPHAPFFFPPRSPFLFSLSRCSVPMFPSLGSFFVFPGCVCVFCPLLS